MNPRLFRAWLLPFTCSITSSSGFLIGSWAFSLPSRSNSSSSPTRSFTSTTTTTLPMTSTLWSPENPDHVAQARRDLSVWPLDQHNAALLNQVHPLAYTDVNGQEPHDEYDLIAIGAGAGGLVSSKQSARRGAKAAMISEHLAGGDCLNVGCVPSKALLRSAKAVAAVREACKFGVVIEGSVTVDFPAVMRRVRECRAKIAPADGHAGTEAAGTHVFQGRGVLTSPTTLQVNGRTLKFKTCVIATGGRPTVPNTIPGLKEAPYCTNEQLFNLEQLPPRMMVLGAGVIALEMAQSFALLGSRVTIINRSSRLLESRQGDPEAAEIIQKALEEHGVTFISNAKVSQVTTLHKGSETTLPLLQVTINDDVSHECECLLVATGRAANVENLGLEAANVEYSFGTGIVVNDFAQSTTNPHIYAVGDCVAGVPRLTHMSGEMAKLVVQNALCQDDWKLSSLVVPAVAYTEPEYATVGIASQAQATKLGIAVDVYRAGLEHNDRAICEGTNVGFCKIICTKGTDEILGATIVAERAGEMINEVSLAMKNKLGLYAIGRNIHSYPTTGEAVMGCGVQYINSILPRFD